MKSLEINYPGDGDWIMGKCEGTFDHTRDHTVALHENGVIQGGVCFTGYTGAAIALHMAGRETNWATRDFLWLVYHYAFVQLGCRKIVGSVSASNTRALSIDKRMGFVVEARLSEMYVDGSDMLILSMTKARCKYLTMIPKHYRSGHDVLDLSTVESARG